MTPFYLIPPNPPFSLEEPNEDQVQLQLFTPPSQVSSSTLSFPLLFSPIQDHVGNYDREQQEQIQPQAKKFDLHGGSNDHQFFPTDSLPTMENNSGNTHKFSICEQQDRDEHRSDRGSIKWMSSKMRLMKKMTNSHEDKPVKIRQKLQDQKKPSSIFDAGINSKNSSNYSNNSIIRTCSDCNTTKTPLWRSGPRGPKSLCNACGIRQRKARRAMAAAASDAMLTSNTSSMKSKVHQKEKKRCKLAPPLPPHGRKKICFEDFFLSLSENSAFHQVFPQDEKDAAILLMALSCGLVHG